MARSCVKRDIHFSPFEMVYRYKPNIQELTNDLRLVEPDDVPAGNDIIPELKNICNLASEKRAKRVCEQAFKQTDTFKINDGVLALNQDKRKLKPETNGPYIVITVNSEFKTCWVQGKNRKKKKLHLDFFWLSKA